MTESSTVIHCGKCGNIIAVKGRYGVEIRHRGRIISVPYQGKVGSIAASIICEKCGITTVIDRPSMNTVDK